jgi:hypothetical protein
VLVFVQLSNLIEHQDEGEQEGKKKQVLWVVRQPFLLCLFFFFLFLFLT